jgi:hypothetical protein
VMPLRDPAERGRPIELVEPMEQPFRGVTQPVA